MSRALAVLAAFGVCVSAGCVFDREQGSSEQTASDAQIRAVSQEVGASTAGRPIEVWFFGDAGPRILLFGGIHGSEPEGLRATEALVDVLRASAGPVRFVVVMDLNPDGSAAGSRYNAGGVDLNRNWPASNFRASRRHGEAPLSEVESRFGHALFERTRPDLVIVLHSIGSGPFVNFDGPGAEQARVFAAAADLADASRSWSVRADMGYPTPGSVGSYIGVDLGVPILTVEFDRGHDELGATAALLAGVSAVAAWLADEGVARADEGVSWQAARRAGARVRD